MGNEEMRMERGLRNSKQLLPALTGGHGTSLRSGSAGELVPGSGVPGNGVLGSRVLGSGVLGSGVLGSWVPGSRVPGAGCRGAGCQQETLLYPWDPVVKSCSESESISENLKALPQ